MEKTNSKVHLHEICKELDLPDINKNEVSKRDINKLIKKSKVNYFQEKVENLTSTLIFAIHKKPEHVFVSARIVHYSLLTSYSILIQTQSDFLFFLITI